MRGKSFLRPPLPFSTVAVGTGKIIRKIKRKIIDLIFTDCFFLPLAGVTSLNINIAVLNLVANPALVLT